MKPSISRNTIHHFLLPIGYPKTAGDLSLDKYHAQSHHQIC